MKSGLIKRSTTPTECVNWINDHIQDLPSLPLFIPSWFSKLHLRFFYPFRLHSLSNMSSENRELANLVSNFVNTANARKRTERIVAITIASVCPPLRAPSTRSSTPPFHSNEVTNNRYSDGFPSNPKPNMQLEQNISSIS